MARPDKAAAVAELTEKFQSSGAAVLTEYRGLTVAQLTKLRQIISEHATYAVVKNTLTDIAAREAGVTAFDGQLAGPSAIAFVTGDPVETARSMRDFARENPALIIRGGLLEGRALTADEVRQLADLEPREVLLAKLAGAMKASMSNAAALFVAPLAQTARVVDALRQKIEQDPAQAAEQEPAAAEPAAEAGAESGTDSAAEGTEPAAASATEPAPQG
jgi:large subunit ribosomal protein L10